jgi:hypothetical protein
MEGGKANMAGMPQFLLILSKAMQPFMAFLPKADFPLVGLVAVVYLSLNRVQPKMRAIFMPSKVTPRQTGVSSTITRWQITRCAIITNKTIS